MKAPTSAQRFEDAKALLDYGFANYALVSVYPQQPLAPVDVLLGTAAGYSFQNGIVLVGAIWTFLALCFLFFGVVNTYQVWQTGRK